MKKRRFLLVKSVQKAAKLLNQKNWIDKKLKWLNQSKDAILKLGSKNWSLRKFLC